MKFLFKAMVKKDIDSIAFLLNRARKNNQPKPIVFLGAGASISAGIPGTYQIIKDILDIYKDKPEIKALEESSKDYYSLMACLNTDERHELLRGYITSQDVKINVTHIYLAQMLKEGWIDYILTVNFDDLLLRACALFNFIPPTYDIAILKDFTTTTLSLKSVTYLHGQHNGFWLLNTNDELKKVRDNIPTVLNRICDKRTWIIVGYSGEDTIFEHIAHLDNFTNELFWVGYNEKEPTHKVKEKLLEKANSNASWVSGYDSDSFFLKLHSALGLQTPDVFNKPFSFLKNLLQNVKDIQEVKGTHKQLFDNVKERHEVALKQVESAIQVYEVSNSSGALAMDDIERDQLKKEIIEAIIKEQYEKSNLFLKKVGEKDNEVKKMVSKLLHNWANVLSDVSQKQFDDNKFKASIENYELANSLDSNNSTIIIDWGIAILAYAERNGNRLDCEKAIEKFQEAINLDENSYLAYYNWGVAVEHLARTEKDEYLYNKAREKFDKAFELKLLNNNDIDSFNMAYDFISELVSANKLPDVEDVEDIEIYKTNVALMAQRTIDLATSSYSLACNYAIIKRKYEALHYLETALENKEINSKQVLQDNDWSYFFSDKDFQNLIRKY